MNCCYCCQTCINVDDFESSADLYFTDRTYEFVKGTQEDGTVMSDAYRTVSPLHEGFYWTFTVVENANYTEPLDYID